MKWLKVFSVFILLHIVAWVGAHWYKSNNPDQVLLVADTSFALKPHFPDMRRWLDDYAGSARYQNIVVGTDKAKIGDFNDIKSTDSIFRVSFGRSSTESLKQYEPEQVDEKIFLSDGTFEPAGWQLIKFQ